MKINLDFETLQYIKLWFQGHYNVISVYYYYFRSIDTNEDNI